MENNYCEKCGHFINSIIGYCVACKGDFYDVYSADRVSVRSTIHHARFTMEPPPRTPRDKDVISERTTRTGKLQDGWDVFWWQTVRNYLFNHPKEPRADRRHG